MEFDNQEQFINELKSKNKRICIDSTTSSDPENETYFLTSNSENALTVSSSHGGSPDVGYKILKRLGWDTIHALGKDETVPFNDPIQVSKRPIRAGLGTI